jgi:transketolase
MAIGLKADHIDSTVYAVMGDGELNEGTCWEACMAASKFKADNLIAIVDRNHVQLDGTSDEIMPLGNLAEKFKAFGFEVFTCNGHDVEALSDTIDLAKAVKGKPAVILAETVKGKGVSFMEGKNTWHGKAINDEECKLALAELRGEK